MIKVLELKGYKSLRALNAFMTIMIGLKMLPQYIHHEFQDFMNAVHDMEPHDQERLIREGAMLVNLEPEEVSALLSFVPDANGVPYSDKSIKNLGAKEIHEGIVAVCVAISKIKVSFVSEVEKKNSIDSAWISDQLS